MRQYIDFWVQFHKFWNFNPSSTSLLLKLGQKRLKFECFVRKVIEGLNWSKDEIKVIDQVQFVVERSKPDLYGLLEGMFLWRQFFKNFKIRAKSDGYLGKKKRKCLPRCIIKKIRSVFPEVEGHIYLPYTNVWFYNAIGNILATGTACLFFPLWGQSLITRVYWNILECL